MLFSYFLTYILLFYVHLTKINSVSKSIMTSYGLFKSKFYCTTILFYIVTDTCIIVSTFQALKAISLISYFFFQKHDSVLVGQSEIAEGCFHSQRLPSVCLVEQQRLELQAAIFFFPFCRLPITAVLSE